MAEQQQNALTSAFPSPPNFYTHFTPANLDRIAALRKLAQPPATSTPDPEDDTLNDDAPTIIPNLPEELKYLQPPPPPQDGLYRSFGDLFNLNDTLPTLAEQNIEQLYTPSPSPTSSPSPTTPTHPSTSSHPHTHTNKSLLLHRLTKSLLLNFLELLGILSSAPSSYTSKLQDLRTLFINFHHLLNEYRPHQAREQVILLMEKEVRRVREEREGVEGMKGRVERLLRGLGGEGVVVPDTLRFEKDEEVEHKKREVYEKRVWEELTLEFGGRRESGASYFEDETGWEHDRGWAGGQYPHV